MVFVPCPPLAADVCPFFIIHFILFSGNEKRPCFDAYAETRTMLSRCHLVSRISSGSLRKCQHIPRDITVTTRRRILAFPCALGGPFERSFPAGLPPYPRSLRGRTRSLSPLHSLWREVYTILPRSSSENNIFFTYFRTIDELAPDRLNLSVLYAIIRLSKMVDAINRCLRFVFYERALHESNAASL